MNIPRPAAALVVACLLAACGRAPDAADAIAGTARQDEAASRAETGGGDQAEQAGPDSFRRSAGDDLRLPDDFPADVLLPESYAVVSVMTMGPAQSVVLRSDVAMATLFDQFRAGQTARGWEETVSMQGVEGAMLGFRKGQLSVLANFRPDMEGHTLVSLSLQSQATAPR